MELSVFLQGVAGNKIYNANNVDNEGMAAAYNQTTAVLNRWTGEGTSYSCRVPSGATRTRTAAYPIDLWKTARISV